MKALQSLAAYGMPTDAIIQRYICISASGGSGWGSTYEPTQAQIAHIRAVNPSVELTRYQNFEGPNDAPTTIGGSGGAEYTLFKNSGWLLTDLNSGIEVQPIDFKNERICDPGNDGYRSWLLTQCQRRASEGYDAVLADLFPLMSLPNKYRIGTVQVIKNPRTNQAYTADQWTADNLTTLNLIRPYCKIHGNSIWQAHDSIGYLANKTRADQVIASPIEGLMVEGPIAWSLSDYNGRSAAVWKQNMDLVKLLVNSGKIVSFSNTGSADMENNDGVSRFIYCSYMLCVPYPNEVSSLPRLYLKFRGGTFMNANAYWTSLVNLEWGSPLGDMVQEGSEYVRYFANGSVRINPSTKTSVIVNNPLNSHNLTLSSNLAGVVWMVNDESRPAGTHPFPDGSTVKLEVLDKVTS